MTWTHEYSRALAAQPATVFEALTTDAALRRWFAEFTELGGTTGAPFRFWGRHSLDTPTPQRATQRLVEFDSPHRLAFTWEIHGVATTVRFAVANEGEGSRLTLHHEVAASLGVPRERELIEDHWLLALGNLVQYLEGGAALSLPDFSDPAPVVRAVIDIAASPSAVFRTLMEPELIARWVGMPGAAPPRVDPRVGGAYSYGWSYKIDGRQVEGGPTRILELIPDSRLVVDWPDWRGDSSVNRQTITFELHPTATGTRLSLTHAGFDRATDMGDYAFGWAGFLDQLRAVAVTVAG